MDPLVRWPIEDTVPTFLYRAINCFFIARYKNVGTVSSMGHRTLGIRLLNCIIGRGGGGDCGGCLDRKVLQIYFGHYSVLTQLDVVCWCTSLNGKELLNRILLSTLKVNLHSNCVSLTVYEITATTAFVPRA